MAPPPCASRSHFAVFATQALGRDPTEVTFLRLAPRCRVLPGVRRATKARALPRFVAPSALPNRRDPPLPGLTFLGHVAPSRLPCVSALYSLDDLPGVLSTRRAHGVRPSELDLTEIATISRCSHPSCDWSYRELAIAVAGATGPKPTRDLASGDDPLPVGAVATGISRPQLPGSLGFLPPWGIPLL